MTDEEDQIIEEHSQNEENVNLALSNNIESETQKKKHNFDASKKNAGKKSDVDKIISFIGNKNQVKKQPGELDFFFASACESTKRLPRRLQLRIKQEVMRAIINAETEFLDQPSATSTSSIVSTETPGRSAMVRLDTPSPISQIIPAPSQTFFHPSASNEVQESTSNVMYENANFCDDSQQRSYYLI